VDSKRVVQACLGLSHYYNLFRNRLLRNCLRVEQILLRNTDSRDFREERILCCSTR
jgi:hypothetical protein